jgi:hypothetical protein
MPIKLAAKPFGFTFDRGFGWSDRIKAMYEAVSHLALYFAGGRDAHPTKISSNLILKFRCASAYLSCCVQIAS